ncbi:gluconate:H+ symporter [Compostibacter hankyongensis]|uniref:Gluconate transporter n=1 Tax=Compostibacter hankyongensis TaxID=1007089 RepID=A0ABP8G098_9BACT
MTLLIPLAGIIALILLILYLKLDPFISFIVVSIGMGLACGMPVGRLSAALETGIGNILGSLVIILGFGAMLGRLVADSGAAQRITLSLTRAFGVRHLQWGMALAGLIVGIPIFYTAGFVIVVPLIFAIANTTRLPLLYVGIPMLSALSVAHGYLPPHPSPTAISAQLHADLGKTLLYGLIVAVPAIILAGPLFGRTLKRFRPEPNNEILRLKQLPESELPGLGISLLSALLPVILLSLSTLFNVFQVKDGPFKRFIDFVGNANMAMLISVLFATWFLGIRRGNSMKTVMKALEDAFKNIAPLMLIIAGSGVFMEVMKEGGINTDLGEALRHLAVPPLILGWLIAAIIRVCIGSATVAGLTTVGMILPLLQQQPVHPELMVLSIGAGSLMFSHVNDGGFWMFKEYFNLSMKDTFRTWSVMETIVSVAGLCGVLILQTLL